MQQNADPVATLKLYKSKSRWIVSKQVTGVIVAAAAMSAGLVFGNFDQVSANAILESPNEEAICQDSEKHHSDDVPKKSSAGAQENAIPSNDDLSAMPQDNVETDTNSRSPDNSSSVDQQVYNKTISGDQADNNSVDTNRSITSIDLGVSNDSEIEQAKMQAKLEYEKAGTPQQITADKATEQQNQGSTGRKNQNDRLHYSAHNSSHSVSLTRSTWYSKNGALTKRQVSTVMSLNSIQSPEELRMTIKKNANATQFTNFDRSLLQLPNQIIISTTFNYISKLDMSIQLETNASGLGLFATSIGFGFVDNHASTVLITPMQSGQIFKNKTSVLILSKIGYHSYSMMTGQSSIESKYLIIGTQGSDKVLYSNGTNPVCVLASKRQFAFASFTQISVFPKTDEPTSDNHANTSHKSGNSTSSTNDKEGDSSTETSNMPESVVKLTNSPRIDDPVSGLHYGNSDEQTGINEKEEPQNISKKRSRKISQLHSQRTDNPHVDCTGNTASLAPTSDGSASTCQKTIASEVSSSPKTPQNATNVDAQTLPQTDEEQPSSIPGWGILGLLVSCLGFGVAKRKREG